MVLGATKNPWGFLGPAVRLDERFLSAPGPCAGGREIEAFFADSPGFPEKSPALEDEDDLGHEYLYIEELPAPGPGGIKEVRPDSQRTTESKRNAHGFPFNSL